MKIINGVNLKKIFIDKILLLLSATAVGIFLLTFLFFLDKFNLIVDWKIYIYMSILYLFTFIYGAIKYIGLKQRMKNILSILFFVFFTVFPIIAGFTIFYFKFLPFPKRNFTYLPVGLFLLPTFLLCLDKSLKFLERRKRSSTTKKEKSLNDL
jgi:hypothetical protein